MLTGTLLLAIACMKLFPETPLARRLHFYLVEEPMRIAAQVGRRHLIAIAILLLAGPALALAPLEGALLYVVDLSVYLDALGAVGATAALARTRAFWAETRRRIVRPFAKVAPTPPPAPRGRTERRLPRRPAANDSEGGWPSFNVDVRLSA